MESSRPHVAVLNVQVEVHSLDDMGQCSGNVLNEQKLAEFNLKPAFLLRVDGLDADDCLSKLKSKLEQFNGK